MTKKNISILAAALGLFGSTVLSTNAALAQATTGAIEGRVTGDSGASLAGVEITIVNPENGFTRRARADSDGAFRFGRLPIGTYDVTVSQGGVARSTLSGVRVAIGEEVSVTLELGSGAADEIVVAGTRTNIKSIPTESALTLDATTIDALPIGRNLFEVAQLAPGVNEAPRFGGVSFGGSSASENAVFINGLNVSDVETGVGFSDAPFSMFEQFQVKTGGYSVEYGRTTGGVINAVLKSGTNDFKAGVEARYEPKWGRAKGKNYVNSDGDYTIFGEDDDAMEVSGTVYASGPIIKDRLFFYAVAEPSLVKSFATDRNQGRFTDSKNDSIFYGGKIDWFITDNHKLEGFVFNDSNDTTATSTGSTEEIAFTERGGLNWAATYTGQFGDNFTLRALYGRSNRLYDASTDATLECNRVLDARTSPSMHLGCTTSTVGDHRENSRDAIRVDAEYQLKNHLLRAGFDYEQRTTLFERASVGPDITNYTLSRTGPSGDIINGVAVAPNTDYFLARTEVRGGTFDQNTMAFYLEDVWEVTDQLTATLGVRWDQFDSKDAEGESFLKISNMISPRGAISYQVDDTFRIYANAGRYYFPIPNGLAAREGGGSTDSRTWYLLDGLDTNSTSTGRTNVTPIAGAQLGDVLAFGGNGLGEDFRFRVDQDLDASKQDEFILGFEKWVTDDLILGMRGIYRRFTSPIEDINVEVPIPGCGEIDDFIFGNPGAELTLDVLCDDDSVQTVTIDLSQMRQVGQDLDGDGEGDLFGAPKPYRKYFALEFVADRTWDGVWGARFAYTYSKSTGNYEGGVNSDTGNDIPGWTESGDDVAFDIGSDGPLPNDRRHAFKMFGRYALTDEITLGANVRVLSGAPINARANGNPLTYRTSLEYNFICVQNCTNPVAENRVYEFIPRGSFGRTPWLATLDLNAEWRKEIRGTDVRFGVDVFNVLNSQEIIGVHSIITLNDSLVNRDPDFLAARFVQSPRYIRFTIGADF
ncbi:MAG: TonB-dependent receptor [Pseudomonadota bacterium]|nr:TonB-dependent receptor [Pseudomonadota bacterium]